MSNGLSKTDASFEYPGAADRFFSRCWLWVALVVVACFGNGLNGEFVLDDAPNIIENQSIRNLWSLEPWSPPAEAFSVVGRPFGNFVFAIDYTLFGLNVRGYHAGNILCHVLAAWALLGCLRRTLSLPSLPPRLRMHGDALALAITLLWAAHPLQTAAVSYVSQRLESLASLWYLLTIYCFVVGSVSAEDTPPRQRKVWHTLAVIACLLGVLTKEIVATSPLLLLLYSLLLFPDGRAAIRRNWMTHLALFATWIPLAYLILHAQGRSGTVALTGQITPLSYFLTQIGNIATYLKLCFWPSPLIFDYGWDVVSSWREVVGPALLLAVLLVATFWAVRFHLGFGFLGVAFFLLLAPTSSFIPILTQTAAEHRMYLPSAVVMTAVVLGMFAVWPHAVRLIPRLDRPALGLPGLCVPLLLTGAVLLMLSGITLRRNLDYRSAETLWRDTVAKRPDNPRARMALASCCQSHRLYQEAIDHCHEAIRVAPDYLNARVCLMRAYFAANRESDAVRDVALRPVFLKLFLSEARRLAAEGQNEEALEQLDRALELKFNEREVQELRASLQEKVKQAASTQRGAAVRGEAGGVLR